MQTVERDAQCQIPFAVNGRLPSLEIHDYGILKSREDGNAKFCAARRVNAAEKSWSRSVGSSDQFHWTTFTTAENWKAIFLQNRGRSQRILCELQMPLLR